MALIRPLVLACLRFNINFAARHIPGRFNILADKLSRSQVGEFHDLAPWANVNPFHDSLCLPTQLPVCVPMMLLFIAHLHAAGSAPASVVSTVSAVAYFHKINGLADPSHCFAVTKVLAGVRSLGAVPDVRLPVTLPVLSRLVHALPALFSSRYKCLMLRAMMVLAFKAYLRIGEMVPRSRSMVRGCLHVDDVLISGDLITLSFRRFKHSSIQGPQSCKFRVPTLLVIIYGCAHADFLRVQECQTNACYL
ncbi:hypothetical protein NP493_1687g00007 [Ridgeia piscesae]|uniref:Uncharacterized protein n=1 Tax=Ridgeia piscesae TaxID=27915 RepID=A0AAD9N9B4_RIDPI|nr:hypothetical protein NP493_1687g00007 [Ridgeia piscesae]